MKKILLCILLIAVIFLAGCISESGSFDKINYDSIKDISQNPSDYYGKNVNVRGVLVQRLGGFSLKDSQDYWIWLDENCKEENRDYEAGSTYSVEGVYYHETDKYSWLNDRIKCTQPLH